MAEDRTELYSKHNEERKACTDAVLNSVAPKRMVLAGTGTGKSFLFQQICRANVEKGLDNNLTLSFINELVDDLRHDLHELSEVKTLHSFALSLIPGEHRVYMGLEKVIQQDYLLIHGKEIDYHYIFCNLIDNQGALKFYSARRKYYGHFSANDSIFTLVKIFENGKLEVPAYSQILVDEFQDFNQLESRLLDLLSTKSPILIAGDDDQSLYSFKYANPNDIRRKHQQGEYQSFQLPFCSRCPEVIINAFNCVVTKAKSDGHLNQRLEKRFEYFANATKDKVSRENSNIEVRTKVFSTMVAHRIAQEIKSLFSPNLKDIPEVIIICPLKPQIESIEHALRKLGFNNIDATHKFERNPLLDAMEILLDEKEDNLGWRILSEHMYKLDGKSAEFRQVLEKSIADSTPFYKLLKQEYVKSIKKILTILRKVKRGDVLNEQEQLLIFNSLDIIPEQVAMDKLKENLNHGAVRKNMFKDTPIKITTILGSKGLTKDYAFLVNFDDKYLLSKIDGQLRVTDEKICNFLVAITRAKVRNYIFTSQPDLPILVQWLGVRNVSIG